MKFALNMLVPGVAVCSRVPLFQLVDGKRRCMLNCYQPRFIYRSAQSGYKVEEKGEGGTCSLQQGIWTSSSHQKWPTFDNPSIKLYVRLIHSRALGYLLLANFFFCFI